MKLKIFVLSILLLSFFGYNSSRAQICIRFYWEYEYAARNYLHSSYLTNSDIQRYNVSMERAKKNGAWFFVVSNEFKFANQQELNAFIKEANVYNKNSVFKAQFIEKANKKAGFKLIDEITGLSYYQYNCDEEERLPYHYYSSMQGGYHLKTNGEAGFSRKIIEIALEKGSKKPELNQTVPQKEEPKKEPECDNTWSFAVWTNWVSLSATQKRSEQPKKDGAYYLVISDPVKNYTNACLQKKNKNRFSTNETLNLNAKFKSDANKDAAKTLIDETDDFNAKINWRHNIGSGYNISDFGNWYSTYNEANAGGIGFSSVEACREEIKKRVAQFKAQVQKDNWDMLPVKVIYVNYFKDL